MEREDSQQLGLVLVPVPRTSADDLRRFKHALNAVRDGIQQIIQTARTYRDRQRKGGEFEDCEITVEIREHNDADRLVTELLIDGKTVPDWLGICNRWLDDDGTKED